VDNVKNHRQSGYLLTRRIVSWAKWFVEQEVSPGDICVDATVGNGNDTLFLAECAGAQGRVYGFDIQSNAIENTKQKLAAAGMQKRVSLIQNSHAFMGNYLAPGTIKAVMFNLGYLPGGNPDLITEPESTVQALDAALHLLQKGGIITVASYRGHAGATEEYTSVNKFLTKLNSEKYKVLRLEPINHDNLPPVLFVAQRY
jgi:16S rRNA C1402 N4-methylase RsmH